MKLSRRCFLSFVIGGTAGSALTPIPWKMMDDVAIWTQNWPWTPVPPDGAYTYARTTCTLCPGNCGILVRKVDGRAVKIEGRLQDKPGGGICTLGLSGLQLLYGPTRIQAPLKRVGERGGRHWRTITWEQAIDEVAGKLADLRAQGKPQSVAALVPSDTGTVPQLMRRLMTAYGSPNFIRMPSADDACLAALHLTHGTNGHAGVDLERSDFILSFGSALMDGYGAPVRVMRAVSRLKEGGGRLVQVEPRMSNTAVKADTWLPANPGTEGDLALAMAHVIIDQDRYNAEFLARRTEGFEAFAALARQYDPRTVSRTTGIDAETITRTALAFAGAKHPLALCGRGKGETAGSLKEALAVHALNTLVGGIDRAGGVHVWPAYNYIDWPDVATDPAADAGLRTQRIDDAGSDAYPHAAHLVHRFIDKLHAGPGPIEALLVTETNPIYSLPDSDKVKAAFAHIPFVVSFSSFMDETAEQADLILPSHLYLERYEDVPVFAGSARPMVRLCRPAVKPLYKTQHPGDTILRIAKALPGPVRDAFPWSDYETCLRDTLGYHWETLRRHGEWKVPTRTLMDDMDTEPIVLMNGALRTIYAAEAPAAVGDTTGFPLLLVPYDSIRLSSGYIGSPPFMVKVLEDTVLKGQDLFVEINPDTAAQLGLGAGQAVQLATPVGTARVRIHLNEGTMPGLVAMPRGLGHTAYDAYLAGKGVNINRLIGSVQDPASGLDAVWGIRAKLTKA